MEVDRARRSEHHFTDRKTEAQDSEGQCLIKTRPPDQAQSCPITRGPPSLYSPLKKEVDSSGLAAVQAHVPSGKLPYLSGPQ